MVVELFNITKPHLAIFGEKDYQQLSAIQQIVRDLNMDIGCKGGKGQAHRYEYTNVRTH